MHQRYCGEDYPRSSKSWLQLCCGRRTRSSIWCLKIYQHFKRWFRNFIANKEKRETLKVLDIALESGIGPIVQQVPAACATDYKYLSIIIQLSLLSFVHRRTRSADRLLYVLQQRLNGALPSHPQAPRYGALLGTIQVCHKQTNNFHPFAFTRYVGTLVGKFQRRQQPLS